MLWWGAPKLRAQAGSAGVIASASRTAAVEATPQRIRCQPDRQRVSGQVEVDLAYFREDTAVLHHSRWTTCFFRKSPTVLLDTSADAEINHEEIFGPVLVVHTYSDIGDAIDYAAKGEHPLSSYWYAGDTPDFQRFLLTSGFHGDNEPTECRTQRMVP